MRKALLFVSCLMPILTFAQSSFHIKGYGKAFKDGDKIFLSYKLPTGIVYDSTLVQKGSFLFKGSIKGSVRGYVCRNDNPKYAEFLRDSFEIYLEPGTITLTSIDTLNNSFISGTALNNDNAILVKTLKPIQEKRRSFKELDHLSAVELKDTALVNLTQAKALALYQEAIQIELSFIKKHPNSYVSLYNLVRISKTRTLLPVVEEVFSKFSPILKAMPEGLEIKRRIAEGKKISIGMQSPDFEQPTINGELIKRSAYTGKYLLIDFWASWCLPCREENPNIVRAYHTYKNRNFTVLSVSIDVLADKEKWLRAIQEDHLPWMQVSDLKKQNAAAKVYGITTIPSNVLLDPTGKVIAKDLKGEELNQVLAKFLGKN